MADVNVNLDSSDSPVILEALEFRNAALTRTAMKKREIEQRPGGWLPIMRHNARQQRAQILSMFLESVPKLRGLASQKPPDLRPNLWTAAV